MSSDISTNPRLLDNHTDHKIHSCHKEEKTKIDCVISVLEKISAVALGIFSAYVDLKLFIPFFFAGVCIGIYSYVQDSKTCHSHPVSACAHGLLEQLTGTKLPPLVSLIANLAVTVCHIDHHAVVFVPIIGISLGNWLGKTASSCGDLMCRKITEYVKKPQLQPA